MDSVEFSHTWESALIDLGIITTSDDFFVSMIVYFKDRIDGKVHGTVVGAVASSTSEILAEIIPAQNMADVIANDAPSDQEAESAPA
ncbi:MAG TPA: hypothetical protein VNE42_09980 [Acidimicrobiales bacterium]|nr:hypothetical protein [Acidimicrobiales bacterium]